MPFKTILMAGLCAAALTVPTISLAQTAATITAPALETHVIVPNFPDAFTTRSTNVTDMDVMAAGQHQSAKSTTTWLTTTKRTADGFHGTVTLETMTSDMPTAPGAATDPAAMAAAKAKEMQQNIDLLAKTLGDPEISYDPQMRPIRIDNVQALLSNFQTIMRMAAAKQAQDSAATGTAADAATSTQNLAMMGQVFSALFSDLTPELAAKMYQSSEESRMPYNRPLALHVPVTLDDPGITMFGASMKLGGTATLDSWEEGKAAHLTFVTAPPEADMKAFASSLVANFLTRLKPLIPPGADGAPVPLDQAQLVADRIINQMHFSVTATCKLDLDLINTALDHKDCQATADMEIDPNSIFPADPAPGGTSAAPKAQPVVMTMTFHMVKDKVLVAPTAAPAVHATATSTN